ncbi:head-tail joining protein [Endozoicomonas sp. ALC013]|uniref:head-tail joining protein n=1 Tax=Endozoicomonas sp. ALC013 TaxID=3403076 RepID=UPI003BB6A990
MDEAFKVMDHTILSTFGQSVLLTFSDHSSLETRGIINKELVELGKYEAVQGEVTVLSVDSAILLKRGDTVLANGQVYEVDRKLKDDGYLAKWNIYAH